MRIFLYQNWNTIAILPNGILIGTPISNPMEEENKFKLGDMVQHKTTGMFGVVISEEDQDKKVDVRNSDGREFSYFTSELVLVRDDVLI